MKCRKDNNGKFLVGKINLFRPIAFILTFWIKIVTFTYDDNYKGCHPLSSMIAREAAFIYIGNEQLTYCLQKNWRINFVQGGVIGDDQDICKNGQMYPSC